MRNYRFVISPRRTDDPRSAAYLADAHALGLTSVCGLRCHDLYFIEGELSEVDLQRLAVELLSDPVTQDYEFTCLTDQAASSSLSGLVEVALRPGVTDMVAEQIVRGARELGIAGVNRASTGLRFGIIVEEKNQEIHHGENREHGETEREKKESNPNGALLHLLAKRLLANAVIQRYAIGEIEPVFPHLAEASGNIETLPVCDLETDGLLALSRDRRAALDLAEMQAIQTYFRFEEREPTDVEIETIAQTWSEHCGHKTF
jgi:phosphoribosylformylglycinamidine synthase